MRIPIFFFALLQLIALPAAALLLDQEPANNDITTAPIAGSGSDLGIAWSDIDGDGDPDGYVVNGTGPNRLVENDGAGAFTDITVSPLEGGIDDIGAVWGDADTDADSDADTDSE